MFEIRAIRKRNCLYIRLFETVTLEDLKQLTELGRVEVEKLRAGYDIISDVSQLSPMEPEVMAELQTRMGPKAFAKHRVIRVVGRSSQSALQVKKLGEEAGYDAYLAFSLEEAYRMLDGGLDLG